MNLDNNQKIINKIDSSVQDGGKKLISPKSNPITHNNVPQATRTVNRLYSGYQEHSAMGGYSDTNDFSNVFADFCEKAQNAKSDDEIFQYIHNIAINKLGYNFLAYGVLNEASKYINVKLLGHVGNTFTSRIFLADEENPIVKSFNGASKEYCNNIDFLKIPYLHNSPVIVLPLSFNKNCKGVLIAGASQRNANNDKTLGIFANYFSLCLINNELMEKVAYNENIDSLTGLKNYRGFQESLRTEINKCQDTDKSVAVIIFDINNISQINREFSAAKGDEIIKIVAEKIKQNIRTGDIAARYGGDEIAVILPDTNNTEACYLAEYLNYSISCCLVDDVGNIGVSIGISTYPTCSTDQDKILMLAEQAMYVSKNKGYKNGMSTLISAENINFWNELALDSLAAVLAKRHSQWGLNFEEELVNKFLDESQTAQNNMIDAVTSLAAAIDAKDTYTRGHSQSVSRYSEALARALNLPDEEVNRIKLGAMLHDVGKIGIPESILGKQEKLTDAEWEIMKQHPSIGVKKVIEPIESLHDLMPMIEHHHEHWNGTGYPHGLKGNDIPLGARIVSIADTFHALISDRPYRKGLPLDTAITILKAGAGVQWDKDLVREFIIIAPSLSTSV